MNRKIVVLGGSFNPPTIAHEKILLSAVQELSADIGIFVPSSDAYVRRKMNRQKDSIIFSEDERQQMLNAICSSHENLQVNTIEYETSSYSGHTFETLMSIQKENPGDEIYFIFGSDKLTNFTRWSTYEEFVTQFKIILFERKDDDIKMQIAENPKLAKHTDAFAILPAITGIQDISSSAIRKALKNNEDCTTFMNPNVLSQISLEKYRII